MSYGLCLHWLSEPINYRADGVTLCFDSAYWSIGLYFILFSIKDGVTRVITTKPFAPELQLKIMQKYKVNTLYSGFFQLIACLKDNEISKVDLSSVHRIFSYGSKMTSNLTVEINHYFPNANITAFYGMTEIGVISERSYKLKENHGSGLLVDGCIAKIIDENGIKCGPNIDGELCVKKTYKFPGYLDDPQLTADAIDCDGFMKTGDIGYFDNNGALFIKDRKKNSIFNVYYFRGMIIPSEIEEYLTMLPGVKEACIVGIQITDGSELPAAVIVKNAGTDLSQLHVFDAVASKFFLLRFVFS